MTDSLPDLNLHLPPCPDCTAAPGTAHDPTCDIARCYVTGWQRLTCGRDHAHGNDVWHGVHPNVADAVALGYFAILTPGHGWVPCEPGTPGSHPDLNRLYTDAVWSPTRNRWI